MRPKKLDTFGGAFQISGCFLYQYYPLAMKFTVIWALSYLPSVGWKR